MNLEHLEQAHCCANSPCNSLSSGDKSWNWLGPQQPRYAMLAVTAVCSSMHASQVTLICEPCRLQHSTTQQDGSNMNIVTTYAKLAEMPRHLMLAVSATCSSMHSPK